MKFAVAPCSWGIEDPNNNDNPPWQTVLDDAGKSGFSGMELGPFGYLPTDPGKLKEELAARKLEVIAGTLYDDLTGKGDLTYLKEKTSQICSLVSSIAREDEQSYLVIIDDVKDIRNNTAGHPELAERLSNDEWKVLVNNIRILSGIAWNEYGVRPVVHPHAGGFIEFHDETLKVVNDLDSEVAGLCLDTGHLFYACSNPAEAITELAERLDYVHFKDINKDIYDKVVPEQMGFFDACKQGVMCSIGKGCVNYDSVFAALKKANYNGWVTIEQERDPRESAGALQDVRDSYNYLQSMTW